MLIHWKVVASDPLVAAVDVLVVPVWEKKKVAVNLAEPVMHELAVRMEARKWRGAWGTAAFFVQPIASSAPLVALIGLGEAGAPVDRRREGLRRGLGEVILDARRHGLTRVGIVLMGMTDADSMAEAAVESATMANYSFSELSSRLSAHAKRVAIQSGTFFVQRE